MRIVYRPLINMETVLTGWHLDGREVVVDASIKGRDAELRLSEDEARGLKAALDAALFKLTAGAVHGR